MKGLKIFGFVVVAALGCGTEEVDESGEEQVEDLNAAHEELANDDGTADSARCSGGVIPDRGPFDKALALTFDDGPSLSTTPEVLDILARHNVKATFFINGSRVTSDEHRALLRRMLEEGHLLGNHTWSHANATEVSTSTLRSQIERTKQVLDEVGAPVGFFRFPFGSSSCSTASTVREYGYKITGWHIDTADWCFASSTGGVGYCSPRTFRYVPDVYRADYIGYTVYQARELGGGVLLMHDIHRFTVGQLDGLLTTLERDGFRFVRLDDTSTFPQLNGAPPPPDVWVGTPCLQDAACSFSYGTVHGYCHTFLDGTTGEERGFCSLACNGYCPDRPGFATTFCTELSEGVGGCVSRSVTENRSCELIPGTAAASRDRFIGTSTASPATATVCFPH